MRVIGALFTTVLLGVVSSPAIAGQDWASIKTWTGTISTVRNTSDEKKVVLSQEIYKIVKTRQNESLQCKARFVNLYQDQQYLSWEGGKFPLAISLDDFLETVTYKEGKVNMGETVTEKGAGPSETEEMETTFGIDTENGVYGFTISPVHTIQVLHSEKYTDPRGRTIREKQAQVAAEHSAAITVENQPLPSSGMVLSGEATVQGGTYVSWTLSPGR